MIIPDKKKIATVILSRLNKGEEGSRLPLKPEVNMEPSALDAITEDLMMGLKNGSKNDVKEALSAFFHEIQVADEKQDAQEEQGENEEE